MLKIVAENQKKSQLCVRSGVHRRLSLTCTKIIMSSSDLNKPTKTTESLLWTSSHWFISFFSFILLQSAFQSAFLPLHTYAHLFVYSWLSDVEYWFILVASSGWPHTRHTLSLSRRGFCHWYLLVFRQQQEKSRWLTPLRYNLSVRTPRETSW